MTPHDGAQNGPGTRAMGGVALGATGAPEGREIGVCAHRLWGDPDGLLCNGEGHPHGHTYRVSSNLDDETAEDQ